MADDALIHLRVPAATKARWVRESRAAGMRLTDWLVSRVERSVPAPSLVAVAIPADLSFADLRLARDAAGAVSFDLGAIARIEHASGLPDGHFASQPEGAVSELIARWYAQHLATGGAPDPVQEDLRREAALEDRHGHGFSHQPGRA